MIMQATIMFPILLSADRKQWIKVGSGGTYNTFNAAYPLTLSTVLCVSICGQNNDKTDYGSDYYNSLTSTEISGIIHGTGFVFIIGK